MLEKENKITGKSIKEKLVADVFLSQKVALVAMILSIVSIILFTVYAIVSTAIPNMQYIEMPGRAYSIILSAILFVLVIGLVCINSADHIKPLSPSIIKTTTLVFVILISIFAFLKLINDLTGYHLYIFIAPIYIIVGVVCIMTYCKERAYESRQSIDSMIDVTNDDSGDASGVNSFVSFFWGVVAVCFALGLYTISVIPYIGVINVLSFFPIMLYSYVFGWRKGISCSVVFISIFSFLMFGSQISPMIITYLILPFISVFVSKVKKLPIAILLGGLLITIVQLVLNLILNIPFYLQNESYLDVMLITVLGSMFGSIFATGMIILATKIPATNRYMDRVKANFLRGNTARSARNSKYYLEADEALYTYDDDDDTCADVELTPKSDDFDSDNYNNKIDGYDTDEGLKIDADYLSKYDTEDETLCVDANAGEVANDEVSNGEVSNGGEVNF